MNRYFILIIILISLKLLICKVYIMDKNIGIDDSVIVEDSLKVKKIRQYIFDDGYLDVYCNEYQDTVRFQFGNKYRLNSIIFKGKPHFSKKQLDNFFSKQNYQNITFTKKNITKIIEAYLDFYEKRGFPLCKIEIDKVEKRSDKTILLTLKIESDEYVKINFLNFRGNKSSTRDVLIRESRIVLPNKFNTEIVNNAEKYLYKSEMFNNIPSSYLVKNIKNKYGIVFEVEETKYNSIDGIVGYSNKTDENGGGFKGKLDLGFENIFGTFRKFRISWFKKSDAEESISLFYQEPWLYTLPLQTALKFEQNYIGDEYLERKYGIEFDYNLSLNFNLLSGYSTENIFPDSLLKKEGYGDTKKEKYSAGFRYSSIYNRFKIEEGLLLEITASTILKSIEGDDDYNDSDVFAKFIFIKNITGNIYFKERIEYGQVFSDSLEFYDKLKIGGINSVRGYAEDQFFTDIKTFAASELHFKIDDKTGLFGFYDIGIWSEENQTDKIDQLNYISGIGVGINYQHNLGEMEVNYAYPLEEGFENGKIHVRYINKF